jgi:hypothetical protein
MRLTRRTLLLAPLALAACAAEPPVPVSSEPVTLVSAFAGRATGRGVFRNGLTGAERRFTARLDGRLRGDVLTVVEDFLYDDGQADRLTWVFTRSGPGTWTGRREDTVGVARVTEDGRVIRLAYVADFRSPGRVTRLGFSDVITRRADGVIVNDAVVRRGGVPVGTVRFEIAR